MILNGQVAAIPRGTEGYPQRLRRDLNAEAPAELLMAGPSDLLDRPMTGFFCSSQCPGSIVLKTFDAITRIRDEGRILIGGFHSVMEWECLGILLRGRQPIIWVPARSIMGMRLRPELVPAFNAGRLLILSPFAPKNKRVTAALAEQRNRFIATVTNFFFIPHAAAGGRTAQLVRGLLAEGKEVCTIEDPSNRELISMGAIPIDEQRTARNADRRCINAVI